MSQTGAETANPICCQHKQAWQVQLRPCRSNRPTAPAVFKHCGSYPVWSRKNKGRRDVSWRSHPHAIALRGFPSTCLIGNYNSELSTSRSQPPLKELMGFFISFAYLDKLKWGVWPFPFDSQLLVVAPSLWVFWTSHSASKIPILRCLFCSIPSAAFQG